MVISANSLNSVYYSYLKDTASFLPLLISDLRNIAKFQLFNSPISVYRGVKKVEYNLPC